MSSSHFGNTSPDSGEEPVANNGLVDPAKDVTESAGPLYDPGPSFADDERPAERLSQLPAWLQTFAATVGNPAEDDPADLPAGPPGGSDAVTATAAVALTQAAMAPDLPTWLADGRPTSTSDSSSEHADIVALEGAALISEDDLPEWLRAIAPVDSDDDNGLVTFGGAGGAPAGARLALSVPSVGRAWMFGNDRPALSEGATVFALMAREAVATTLPAPAIDMSPSTAMAGAPAAAPGASAAATPDDEPPPDPLRAGQASTPVAKPRRMWMVYLLALLLVILVLLAVRLVI